MKGFGGSFDNIQIHNRALTDDEINTVSNGGVISGENLVAHYDFEGDHPYTDKSEYGNDATRALYIDQNSDVDITADMGSGDEMVYLSTILDSENSVSIDFGEGFDTLIIEEDIYINFDDLASSNHNISNLEVIDMQNGTGNNTLENLDLSDVLLMTDSDNELLIWGDMGDQIELNIEGSDAEWVKDNTQITKDGEEFDLWTNSDNDATLFIDTDITLVDI